MKKGFRKRSFFWKRNFFSFPVVAPPWWPPHRHRKTHSVPGNMMNTDRCSWWTLREEWEKEEKERRKREKERRRNENFLGFLPFYTRTGPVCLDRLNQPDRPVYRKWVLGLKTDPAFFFFCEICCCCTPFTVDTPYLFLFVKLTLFFAGFRFRFFFFVHIFFVLFV